MREPYERTHSSDATPCANCGQPLAPGDRFCGYCGTSVAETRSVPQRTAKEGATGVQSQLPPGVLERLASHVVTRPVRELFFLLGLALGKESRPEATEYLKLALQEESGSPDDVDIFYQLARSSELAGNYETAVEFYLQAMKKDDANAVWVLDYVHRLLTPAVALSLGRHILRACQSHAENSGLSATERSAALLFAGHTELFLAEYDSAVKHFEQAISHDAGRAKAAATIMFDSDNLPPALAPPQNAYAHFVVARLHDTFDSSHEALHEVNLALEMGLHDDGAARLAALKLKGELEVAVGDVEQAADAFFEVARYLTRSDEQKALEFVVRAMEIRREHKLPDRIQMYWHQMDLLRVLSHHDAFPYVIPEQAQASLAAWEEGVRRGGYPDSANSWAFTGRALLNEQLVRLPKAKIENLFWEAIANLQFTLVLTPNDSYAWAYLSRFYRFLNINCAATDAALKAVQTGPSNPIAHGERAAILANVGRLDEAERAIDEANKLEPSTWVDAVKAYLLVETNRTQEALTLIDQIVSKSLDLWYLMLRVKCWEKLDQPENIKRDCEEVWRRFNPDDTTNFTECAEAAYKLGYFDEALKIFEKLGDLITTIPGDRDRGLAQCYFAMGDIDVAKKHAAAAIAIAQNETRLEYLKAEMLEAEATASRYASEDLDPVLSALHHQIDKRRQWLRDHPNDAKQEFQGIVKDKEARSETKDWVWVGAQTSLAKIHLDNEDPGGALLIYQRIKTETPMEFFPVCQDALQLTVQKLQKQGIGLAGQGRNKQAVDEAFAPALECVKSHLMNSKKLEAGILAQLGSTALDLNDPEHASAMFQQAMAVFRAAGLESPGLAVAQACRPLISDIAKYWEITDTWTEIASHADTNNDLFNEFEVATSDLAGFLGDWYGLGRDAGKTHRYYLSVTQIAVELGSGFQGENVLSDSYIPDMLDRILDDLGVSIPEVRVWQNEAEKDSYLIRIDEVPLVLKTVNPDRRFSPVPPDDLLASNIPSNAIIATKHPLTAAPGCWVLREAWEKVGQLGHEIWMDPLLYIAYDLERTIRDRLSLFFGYQEVESLLDEWEAQEATLIRSALPDSDSRGRFARVLRALVKEQVPIKKWRAILKAIIREDAIIRDDISPAVRTARLSVREDLPGNDGRSELIFLDDDVEARIAEGYSEEADRTCFALLPENCRQILDDIRARIPADYSNCAIVVKKPQLRASVWRMLDLEFPSIQVLAKDELTTNSSYSLT